MAHNLIPTPGMPDIPVPDDGDNLQASSVEVGFQALADWVTYLNTNAANDFDIGGNLTVHGDETVNGALAVFGQCTITSLAAFFECDTTAEFTDAVRVYSSGTFRVDCTGTFTGDVACSGHVTSNLRANFNSGFAAYGDCTHNSGIIKYIGSSRCLRKAAIVGANANTTYSPADYQRVTVSASDTLGADRNYTITNTGVVGDFIRISCNHATRQINVSYPGFIISISGALTFQWLDLEVITGGTMRCVAAGQLPVGV